MSDAVIRVLTPEDFYEQIDKMAESMPDRGIALGRLQGRYAGASHDSDANIARLAEFAFPAELFDDGTGVDALDAGNSRLAATGVMPSKYLDPTSRDVLDYDEYKQYAREIASKFRDPIFYIGAWNPSRSYQMTGNPDNSKPRKIGSMAYPEDVFATAKGCEPLHKLHLGFPGTVVVEAEDLTDETVAYARGDRDELPIEEREDDRMDAEEINDILRGLSEGDRVQVNDRNRPLEVVPRSETRQIGVANHECVFLSSNGTDYRISIPNRDSRYPELEWSSDSEYIGELQVTHREATEQTEVAA